MNDSKLGARTWFAAVAILLVMSGAWMLVSEPEGETAASPEPEPDPRASLTRSALASVSRAQSALAEQNYGKARAELDEASHVLQTLIGEPKRTLAARQSD